MMNRIVLVLSACIAGTMFGQSAAPSMYGQVGIFAAGVGTTYHVTEKDSAYLHAGIFVPLDAAINHYTMGVFHSFESFYVRGGLGYAASRYKSGASNAGPAIEAAFGQIWKRSESYTFGIEWLGAGYYRALGSEYLTYAGWLELPQLRGAWLF